MSGMTDVLAPRVVLEDFPFRLFAACDEQWEAMLREYVLRGLGGAVQSYDNGEVTRAANALAAISEAADDRPDVAEHGTLHLDVTAPADFALLQGILDDALTLAAAGELLVFPSLPEVIAFRNWMCDQVLAQSAGAPADPWQFVPVERPAEDIASDWDGAAGLPIDAAWLLGDEHNRIVGASPAALELLGWTAEELIGQRLLAVIPSHLRERHVAAFTRSVVSGGGVRDDALPVPALTRDGREVPVVLTLSRHAARRGARVYLARLEPVPA